MVHDRERSGHGPGRPGGVSATHDAVLALRIMAEAEGVDLSQDFARWQEGGWRERDGERTGVLLQKVLTDDEGTVLCVTSTVRTHQPGADE